MFAQYMNFSNCYSFYALFSKCISINIFEERLFWASGQAGGGAPSSLPASCPDTPVCNSWCHLLLKVSFYPPKRPLRDAFPAQNTILSAKKGPAGRISSPKILKTVFPGAYFGFDICNLKLFASKNSLRVVPSLQNVIFTYF